MAIEDIQLKDPEVATKEMTDNMFDSLFGAEGDSREAKSQGEPQPETQEPKAKEESSEPNVDIRLKKFKEQRDQERAENQRLKEELARLKGREEVLTKKDDADEVDPTEYMSDTEKALYERNQELTNTVKQLADVVNGIKKNESQQKIQNDEDSFFESHPELKEKREQVTEELLEFLQEKPELKKLVVNRSVNINQVYAMMEAGKPKELKKRPTNEPAAFSGSTKTAPSGSDVASDLDTQLKKASEILSNPESTNKREAAEFLGNTITEDIISQLEI